MASTATGSKARWAPQARRKACMGWSWAAACGVHGREQIVRPRPQLVLIMLFVSLLPAMLLNKDCQLEAGCSKC